MNIRDTIKERSENQVIQVAGDPAILDPVFVRRLKARDMLKLADLDEKEGGLAMVAMAVVDEDGALVFPAPGVDGEDARSTLDAVRDLDLPLFQLLINACNQVNGLEQQMEAARKN